MTRTTGDLLPAVRGGLLGLLLGDAVGATGGTPTAHGTLRATCAGQLACCTVEGLIRAHVRDLQRGICHPPSVVWNAYRRWAAAQGISGTQQPGLPEPDGWLAQVSLLGQRRGDAPATVRALRERVMGTVDSPVGPSIGAHGLTRSLPAWV
ncbi:MAG TPA: hypothetical protein VGD43_06135, partial [Micromonospora sp.]